MNTNPSRTEEIRDKAAKWLTCFRVFQMKRERIQRDRERERGLVEVETFFEISIRIRSFAWSSRQLRETRGKIYREIKLSDPLFLPPSLGTIIAIINARAIRLYREKTRNNSPRNASMVGGAIGTFVCYFNEGDNVVNANWFTTTAWYVFFTSFCNSPTFSGDSTTRVWINLQRHKFTYWKS